MLLFCKGRQTGFRYDRFCRAINGQEWFRRDCSNSMHRQHPDGPAIRLNDPVFCHCCFSQVWMLDHHIPVAVPVFHSGRMLLRRRRSGQREKQVPVQHRQFSGFAESSINRHQAALCLPVLEARMIFPFHFAQSVQLSLLPQAKIRRDQAWENVQRLAGRQ